MMEQKRQLWDAAQKGDWGKGNTKPWGQEQGVKLIGDDVLTN